MKHLKGHQLGRIILCGEAVRLTEESTIFLVGKCHSTHRIDGVFRARKIGRWLISVLWFSFLQRVVRASPVHVRC